MAEPALPREEAVKQLERVLQDLQVTAERLDSVIHDSVSISASNINNGGLPEQLKHLLQNNAADALRRTLTEMDVELDLKPYIDAKSYDALAGALEASGLAPDDLDDLVHDSFGEGGAHINNGGVSEQLGALVDELGFRQAEALLREKFGAKGARPRG